MRSRQIFQAILAVTFFSALVAVALQVAGAAFQLPNFEALIVVFADTFKLGVGAILGMLGAKAGK